MSNKRNKGTVYSESFKWQVVQEVLQGRMTKEEARVAYGIKSNCSILYWMRRFSGNDQYRTVHTFGNSIDKMADSKIQLELELKVKQLEEDLRLANLRADLWQKMVEVAEKNLKIDIKKKHGA